MESSKRRSYTAEQRDAVLADVRTMGINAAAKKHDVAQSCVSRWASIAGVRRAARESSSAKPAPDSPVTPSEAARVVDSAGTSPAPSPPVKRPPRSRVAKVYAPSQKAVVLEDAA